MSDDLPTPAKYHGNSTTAKAKLQPKSDPTSDKPEIEAVTKGVKRKKSAGKRFIEAFTGEDVQSVGQYVLWDVMIPAAKSMILDAVTTAIERAMYGDSRPRSSSSHRSGYTPYNRINKPSSTRYETGWKPRELSRAARASHNFDEILLPDRSSAEDVLSKLTTLIDQYEVASVSSLYSLVDISGSFTDDKWGWTKDEVGQFDFRRIPQGYVLILPPPVELR